jgi:cytidine deaminase
VNYKKLIEAAQKAKEYSYSPHSNFRVGAAIITQSGKIYTGCNIENSSFSLTICAERTAIFKAVSDGQRKFEAIAIVTDLKDPIPPCGACRQVLMDMAGDIDVIIAGNKGDNIVYKLSKLLPMPFNGSMLTQNIKK